LPKRKGFFRTLEKRGRYRHRDRNCSRYRKPFIIGRLNIDAGSAKIPKSIPVAIAIPIPIVPFPGVGAWLGCGHRLLCDGMMTELNAKEACAPG